MALRREKKNASSRGGQKPKGPKRQQSTDRGNGPAWSSGWSWPSAESIRDTVEALVVALILAFLIRTFEAEAFVIPTGSMAPTLMGRHRDVTCLKCGYEYQVGASEELTETGQDTGYRVIGGTCPMCGFTMDLGPGNAQRQSYPSYGGDRIVVGKYLDPRATPRRWDVVVFHFPLAASTDYIKRVAGLPHETLRVQYGKVWTRPEGAKDFTIEHKPPDKVLAMMRLVYDNDYVLADLVAKGIPARWGPMKPGGEPGGWQAADDLKSFHADGTAAEATWLCYRHIVPGYEQWAHVLGLAPRPPTPPQPRLITDFTAYDTGETWYFGKPSDPRPPLPRPEPRPGGLGLPPDPARLGLNWVGDLVLECDLKFSDPQGEVLLMLVKGGRQFLCRLDLAEGTAALSIAGDSNFQPASTAGISKPGRHRLRMANVDQQLLLWLDGRLVNFDSSTEYDRLSVDTRAAAADDLMPVRIGSRGVAVEVSRLRVYRDIYYIAQEARHRKSRTFLPTDLDPSEEGYPYTIRAGEDSLSPQRVAAFLSDPGQWRVFRGRSSVEFTLEEGQFFMLGDNSAASLDSRLWDGSQFYVDRKLLVGEALFVYWPHSWDRLPGTPIPLPFFPNFARMRLVR